MTTPAQTVLPRWRGFNLLYYFTTKSDCEPVEDDFRWMADWGFDFARFPMCYTLWTEDDDVYKIKESTLEKIDRGVEYGRKYGIHINLNVHRGPGFSVNREREEPFSLWKDPEALEAFCFHWELFAKRYKGIASSELSFNLINEPKNIDDAVMSRADHERMVRTSVARIRAIDPERLIIADGTRWANDCCPELADLGIAQSCRAYWPHAVSHHQAPWAGMTDSPEPSWPVTDRNGQTWNRGHLEEIYKPWAELARRGIGVHCGEGGCFCKTPHDVFLAWFRDVLEILTEYNIGYALWNFRGPFGVLDTRRTDIEYEDFHGHQLDRQLLDLLREF